MYINCYMEEYDVIFGILTRRCLKSSRDHIVALEQDCSNSIQIILHQDGEYSYHDNENILNKLICFQLSFFLNSLTTMIIPSWSCIGPLTTQSPEVIRFLIMTSFQMILCVTIVSF